MGAPIWGARERNVRERECTIKSDWSASEEMCTIKSGGRSSERNVQDKRAVGGEETYTEDVHVPVTQSGSTKP